MAGITVLIALILGIRAACGVRFRGSGKFVGNITKGNQVPFEDPAEEVALRQCASGKRIVYIGDSTFRYEYMAMAYFIEHGRWPTGSNTLNPDPSSEMNVISYFRTVGVPQYPLIPGCVSGGGQVWEPLYRYTNALLNNNEACDCFRMDNDGQGTTATENRMYKSADGSVSVSYFQWFGEMASPRGTMDILARASKHIAPACPPGQKLSGSSEWRMDLPAFVSTVVRQLRPTHLIIALAWWPSPHLDQSFWSSLATAGAAAVSDTGGIVYWRTTPKPHGQTAPSETFSQYGHFFQQAGWQIYSAEAFIDQLLTFRSNKDVFWDGMHLSSQGNCYTARAFLRNICGL
eukprot:TRINITY_DN61832_c0_g1_i1.p1 TRINITY_DN61832_c0_g1~~TRINITY_DN61832_c0_g1_i1.p1  ORF type:complete len:346 (+),score=31.80 TRINITY_DN61832_c0_g1_i1:57-1094(+)